MDGAAGATATQRAILDALRAGPRTMAALRRDVGDEGLHGTMGERDPFEEDVVALVEAGLVADPDGFLRRTSAPGPAVG